MVEDAARVSAGLDYHIPSIRGVVEASIKEVTKTIG